MELSTRLQPVGYDVSGLENPFGEEADVPSAAEQQTEQAQPDLPPLPELPAPALPPYPLSPLIPAPFSPPEPSETPSHPLARTLTKRRAQSFDPLPSVSPVVTFSAAEKRPLAVSGLPSTTTSFLQVVRSENDEVMNLFELDELIDSFLEELTANSSKTVEVVDDTSVLSAKQEDSSSLTVALKAPSLIPADSHDEFMIRKTKFLVVDIEKIKAKALKKDAEALYELGQYFKKGFLVIGDLRKYYFLTYASARQEYTPAQAEMSRIYRDGLRGIAGAQLTKAISFAEAAAASADAECNDYLGRYHFDRREYPKAKKFLEIAALLKVLTSIICLKRMHTEGLGCSKSGTLSLVYRILAANLGDAESLYELHLYHKGREEWDSAVEFAEKAAGRGHSEGGKIGLCLFRLLFRGRRNICLFSKRIF